jgi:hypothetical protein
VPDKPIPDDDPIVSKSLAPHYVVAVILLMATLFWALWDEDFGQRPWKNFQQEWKNRYSTFLKTARSQSNASQKDVEAASEYKAVKLSYEQANQSAAPRVKEINEKLRDLSGKILAVQNVFTDRRAYVNASTYDIETETSNSAKQRKQRNLDQYKQEVATVEYPDGSKQKYNYPQLEETYKRAHRPQRRAWRTHQARQRTERKVRRVRFRAHGQPHALAARRLAGQNRSLGPENRPDQCP